MMKMARGSMTRLAVCGLALCTLLSAGDVLSFICFGPTTAPIVAPSVGRGEEDLSRREMLLPGLAALAGLALEPMPALAEEDAPPNIDVPDRIKANPYELIGITNPDDKKTDRAEFYIKKKYGPDTYRMIKHMKISASLEKGSPEMERFNKRVKEEMDDWLGIYRHEDISAGRQSFYTIYTCINYLASHFTSYGPKFPFPNKRRARFFQLINQAEKYLEKKK